MLLALADYSDDSGESYPSVATLAGKCRMNVRNAHYVLSALKDSGELIILYNQGPNGTNRYKVLLETVEDSAPLQSVAPLNQVATLQSSAPPATDCTLQSVAHTSATGCTKPLQRIADKPSLKRQEPSTMVQQAFERFYQAYPKKVERPKAMKAFKTARADKCLDLILLDLEIRCATEAWTKEGGRYIPHPASYLNNRRWEDLPTQIQLMPSPAGGILPGAI
jgi:hypothetical protein